MASIKFSGVEKNLFIISNYLSEKLPDSILIITSKSWNSKFEKFKRLSSKLFMSLLLNKSLLSLKFYFQKLFNKSKNFFNYF